MAQSTRSMLTPPDDPQPIRHTQRIRTTSAQRRGRSDSDSELESISDESDDREKSNEELAKDLVRYALGRQSHNNPIRRQDIGVKVLRHNTRAFRPVFDLANSQLMDVFGLRMEELPARDRVTTREKRAAAASDGAPKNTNVWLLQSTLPHGFRAPGLIGAGRPPPEEEFDVVGAKLGFYTLVVSLIYLCGGTLPELKLDRFLRRMGVDDKVPFDYTDRALARMAKEGYLTRIRDSSTGEDLIDYMAGPRAKLEIGKEGAMGLVRAVYGVGNGGAVDEDDLEQRLRRSLGTEDEVDDDMDDVDGLTNGL